MLIITINIITKILLKNIINFIYFQKVLLIFNRNRIYERIISIINLKLSFNNLKGTKNFLNRNDLHKDVFANYEEKKICLLEFGTFKGESIKNFLTYNQNKDSLFYGFDSFEGLPQDWVDNYPKGTFDLNGELPKFNDKRLKLIKGFFQNTLENFFQKNKISGNLIVHYDADLFSSTLYCLLQVDKLKIPYVAIFDEFYADEANALKNYIEITGAEVNFIGKTNKKTTNLPIQVSCEIIPANIFEC